MLESDNLNPDNSLSNNILRKPIEIWVAISKNNTIQLFSKLPIRGNACWIGENYINSIIYDSIKDMIKNSTLSWNSEPEFLELSYKLDEMND